MPYVPTVWVSGVTALDAAPLNNLETQYDEAVYDIRHYLIPKTADETINNVGILQNDDELVLPVLANEIWLIHMTLRTNSAVADIQWLFTVPAAGAMVYWCPGVCTATVGVPDGDATVAHVFTAAAGVNRTFDLELLYTGGANAGNVQLQWAQNGGNASDTKVLKGSALIGRRISP